MPFYFDYITYKKGTDILSESQQYRLCLDLLDEGYEVYICENKSIINQVKDHLYSRYENNIHFVTKNDQVKVDVFGIFV